METYGLLLLGGAALLLTAAGILFARGKIQTLEDYITARRSLGPAGGAATLAASVLGAWILFSPAEAATWGGIPAILGYGIGSALAVWTFIFLGRRMRRLVPEGHSVPEFVYHRYGRVMYTLTLVVGVLYMLVFLAAEMTGIALAVHLVLGTPLVVTAAGVGLATLAYTAYGGMRASLFTDTVQTVIILPLVAVALLATAAVLGGSGEILSGISDRAPELLTLDHGPGLELAATLVIAIIGANLFHQGYWQRLYALEDEDQIARTFGTAGAVVLVLVMAVGLFGLFAVSQGPVEAPSVALFQLVLDTTPPWVILSVLLLALMLVMSSVDTLLNALVSLFTVDLARMRPAREPGSLMAPARWLTVAIAAAAIAIASQGYSVLYLFLLADLLCVAAAFPTFYGLYEGRLSGTAAAGASLAGMVAGLAFFPDPSLAGGSLLWAFLAAAVVPAIISLALGRRGRAFDFSRLQDDIRLLDADLAR